MTLDVRQLRQTEFPWAAAGESIYLNTASTGPLPRRTVEAVARFTEMRAAPHRMTQEIQFGTLTRSRELIAKLIGARTSEIALATNTSFGLNIAAASLPLGPGDVVLGYETEFPANVYPWMSAAKHRGFEFRLLPAVKGVPSQQALLDAMAKPGVKAVAISWVEFASGYRFDLDVIGAECRRRNIFFVVDAIQGLGPATLDVRKANIDILACGAQKWLLSPWGTGFTWVREELIGSIEPGFVSWMGVRGSDDFSRLVDYDLTWRDDARKFEFITLPFQEFAGLNATLELFFELGPAEIAAYTGSLADRVLAWARDHQVDVVTPREAAHHAGIVALRLPDSDQRSARLQDAGVVHSLREGAIRFAPYFFNTSDEIDRALDVLAG
ncbi:MAG TPA: aminotransferase class V-fold PLP-dependent enzyme [Gemmatimonadaceae bacterium]|nr:aminotransferase class V-fold PLP-dependent enzyme [Gemmatimonadaceae bacterium]